MNINDFGPFEAEVWGTVSDWGMAMVTAATLYFIVRTFRSQLKVQQLQQHYTHIENEKFRLEVVPSFELKVRDRSFVREPGEVVVGLMIDLELLRHECRELVVDISSIIYQPKLKTIFPETGAHVPAGRHYLLTIECRANEKTFEAFGLNLTVSLQYKDVVGNGYVMSFMVNLNFTDLEVIPNGPFRTLESAETD